MIRIASNRPATIADIAYTAAHLPFIRRDVNAPRTLQIEAQKHGMTPVPGMANAFIAQDGSWAYLDSALNVQRGVRTPAGDVQLQGIPAGQLNALGMVPLAASPLANSAALAQVSGAGGPAEWAASLTAAGFVANANNANHYTHPNEPGLFAVIVQDAVAGHQLIISNGSSRVDPATLPGKAVTAAQAKKDAAAKAKADAAAAKANPAPAAPPPPKINLGACQLVAANQPAFGAFACAQLPRINATSAALLQAVEASGIKFTVVGPDQYQFQDGSFVLLGMRGAAPSIERGYEANGAFYTFRGVPPSVMAHPLAAPQSILDTTAAAGFFKTPVEMVPAGLVAQGFTQVPGTPYFTHADGSWVALPSGAQAIVGYGQQRVDGNSFRAPPPPPQVPKTLAPGEVGNAQIPTLSAPPAHMHAHGNTWPQWKAAGFRVAWLPWAAAGTFTQPQLHQVLRYLGFTQSPGNPSMWVHPDSSSVQEYTPGALNPATITFMGQGFRAFPYTSAHGTWLGTEAQMWKSWMAGTGLAPTDDPNWKRSIGV